MCGRFTLASLPEEISALFGLNETPSLPPRYNITPSQEIAAVGVRASGERGLALLCWGLVPHWARDPKIGHKLTNARSETAAYKPSFREAFRHRRCLIPADGFYEWKAEGNHKLPHYVRMADGGPFAMAGLWERWRGPRGEEFLTVTILTTGANDLMVKIHPRMPVILHPEDFALWLDPAVTEPARLQPLLAPFPAAAMEAYPVDTRVNKPDQDDPLLIEPTGEAVKA